MPHRFMVIWEIRVNATIIENSGSKSLGPVGHPAIARQMAEAMSLKKEHVGILRQLPVGSFIETYMYGFPYPIVVRSPFRKFRRPTEEELYQAEHALDDLKAKSWEEAHRIEVQVAERKERQVAENLSAEVFSFLMGINDKPFLTVVERFEYYAIHRRKGNELKKWCLDHELIEEKRVPLGKGGVPVLLQLTPRAQELLGLPRVNEQIVHSYAKHLVVLHCEKFGAEATPEVDDIDVLVKIDGLRIAVEVEVAGTQALKNLEKNCHCDRIIFVAIDMTARKRLEKRLRPDVVRLGLDSKVTFLTLGEVVKSEELIFKYP